MPDIPSHKRKITVKPVGKAPLPVSAADVGAGARGAGLQAVGKGVGDIGNVLFQIKQEQLALSDAINETKANAYIDSEKKSFNTYMSETDPNIIEGQPSAWELESEKSFNRLRDNIAELPFSDKTQELINAKLEALAIIRDTDIRRIQSEVLVRQTKAFLPENLKKAIASGDSILIADAFSIFNRNRKRVWGSDQAVADEVLREAVREGMMERAAIKPERTWSFVDTELKARAKGKKAFEEFALLSNTDLETIRDYADSTIKANRTAKKIEQDQKDDEIGDTFLDLLINKLEPTKPQLTFDKIVASKEMSFDAKSAWLTRLQTFDNYSESELKEAFTDKGEVLAEIYDKIDDETLTDELDTMVGKGLSPTTAQRIKKEVREPYEKDTDKLFKNIFGWSPELGYPNELAAFLYEKTLRDWKEEIKRQNATGEKIIEIGRSVARPYFIEHLQKTMTGQESDIARMVELALGEESEKTEPEVKPKEDEGPKTYQEFEDEVARLKKIDMDKAKAFYDAWIDKFSE